MIFDRKLHPVRSTNQPALASTTPLPDPDAYTNQYETLLPVLSAPFIVYTSLLLPSVTPESPVPLILVPAPIVLPLKTLSNMLPAAESWLARELCPLSPCSSPAS